MSYGIAHYFCQQRYEFIFGFLKKNKNNTSFQENFIIPSTQFDYRLVLFIHEPASSTSSRVSLSLSIKINASTPYLSTWRRHFDKVWFVGIEARVSQSSILASSPPLFLFYTSNIPRPSLTIQIQLFTI